MGKYSSRAMTLVMDSLGLQALTSGLQVLCSISLPSALNPSPPSNLSASSKNYSSLPQGLQADMKDTREDVKSITSIPWVTAVTAKNSRMTFGQL